MQQQPTSVTYSGDGNTTSFTVPFIFVNRADIQVFVNGVQTFAFTWTSGGQVSISPAPSPGAVVLISRATRANSNGFNFQQGALRAADLDNAMRQCLYVAQEAHTRAAVLPTGRKSLFFTAMEAASPGSVGNLATLIPADPSDPVNIAFNHDPFVSIGDALYTFIAQQFPSLNMPALAAAAGAC